MDRRDLFEIEWSDGRPACGQDGEADARRPAGTSPAAPRGRAPSLSRYADFVARHHAWVLLAALLLAGLAAWRAASLELRTNFAELLPSKDPAVAELKRTTSKIGGTQVLQVAVEGPDRDANLAFASALAERVRKLPPRMVEMVTFDVRDEKRFFAARKWLYADLDTLEKTRDALRARIDKTKNPLMVDLDDDAGDSLETLADRLKSRAPKLDVYPTGFFEGGSPDLGDAPGTLVAVVIRPPGSLFGEHAGEPLRAAVQKIIAELAPARFICALHKGADCAPIRVGLTGDVMAQLDERAALENDLAWATAVCVVLVCLVVVLFYGRLRAVPFVGIPALLGVAVAFGAADLLFGYLNSSTAFMGSIVVGNGINFAIIQYARYEEERRRGLGAREAARVALATTIRPTAVAALGAAAAYGSLLCTRFRGFSQFGIIGGIGMVAAWLSTVTVLPALWARFDRGERSPTSDGFSRRLSRLAGSRSASFVSRMATRFPRALLCASLGLTLLAVMPMKRYLADPFEYDFTHLRNRKSLETGAAALAPRVDRIFGRTLTPAAIVADRRDQTEAIRRAIYRRDRHGARPLIGDLRTLDDFLPGSPEVQAKKLAVLSDLRGLLDDPALALLPDEERAKLRALRPPDDLRPVGALDLPRTIRMPFTETDGTLGRVVLVYHDEAVSVWDGRNLVRIADLIGEVPLDDGEVVRSSGHAVVFAAMIRSIRRDAPLATCVSLAGVALLVLALSRGRRGAALVLGVLVAGVMWMLGAAAWLGVRANFLNFIALPITFGIGVDYGINIYLRYRLEHRHDDHAGVPGAVERAVKKTGGAVVLCSLTTMIGYGALLCADNQALRSFGEMAILGELACLSAAVAVLPAFLVWLPRRAPRAVLASASS